MPYAVSVRQVSGLPPASFRSRLAADTLALGYVLGATPCTRDFHPLERAHAERTMKNNKRILAAIAIPKYYDLRDKAIKQSAMAVAAECQARVNGVFAQQLMANVKCESARTTALN